MVTWGERGSGGDYLYGNQSNVTLDSTFKLGKVETIYSNRFAFAAMKPDGSVVTWGHGNWGGDNAYTQLPQFKYSQNSEALMCHGVETIYSGWGFAVLKTDGSVFTVAGPPLADNSSDIGFSSVASKLASNVKTIYSNQFTSAPLVSSDSVFAALKTDGSVVTWGDKGHGGDSSDVAAELSSNVETIYSNKRAFAALKTDGSVVTWGGAVSGGDSSSVESKLGSNVETIYATLEAFAALKTDGSVVTWGDSDYGGDSSSVAAELASNVKTIYSTEKAFAALKTDGSVVTWGKSGYGGNSSSVAAELEPGLEPGCIDIDECATADCGTGGSCSTPTVNSYTCTCDAGYEGGGIETACINTNVDECATGADNCNKNAMCTDTPGSFYCACNPGYSGDGLTCTKCGDGVLVGAKPCDCGVHAKGSFLSPGSGCYAACDNDSPPVFFSSLDSVDGKTIWATDTLWNVYRSDDAGLTWQAIQEGPKNVKNPDEAYIHVNPADPDNILVVAHAPSLLGASASDDTIMVSHDGMKSHVVVDFPSPSNVQSKSHIVSFSLTDPKRIYLFAGNKPYLSDDAGDTWTSIGPAEIGSWPKIKLGIVDSWIDPNDSEIVVMTTRYKAVGGGLQTSVYHWDGNTKALTSFKPPGLGGYKPSGMEMFEAGGKYVLRLISTKGWLLQTTDFFKTGTKISAPGIGKLPECTRELTSYAGNRDVMATWCKSGVSHDLRYSTDAGQSWTKIEGNKWSNYDCYSDYELGGFVITDTRFIIACRGKAALYVEYDAPE